MTRAQRMHRKLIEVLCAPWVPSCAKCPTSKDLEIDHPEGRRRAARNRAPEHRRKSYAARVKEYWLAFAAGEPLRVLCRSCNAQEGGGRRYQ
jgi:hypothetical protein